MKICTKCGFSKPATPEFFHAYKRSPDGRRAVCILCRSANHAANKDVVAQKRREFYKKNRDRLMVICKAFYWKNPEAHRKSAMERHFKNHSANLARQRAYLLENSDRLNENRRPKNRQRFHERYGTDPVFTLKHRLRSLVRISLRKRRRSKRLTEALGFTVQDLRVHLERQFLPGMNWELFMAGEIHLDHIIPIDAFRPASCDSPEFKSCWSLSNLRPAWARDNLSKQNKVLTLL